jgi:hydrogenase maturation protease
MILVAGIGNIFLGDDAFGSEVARQLASRPQRAGVRVIDFGIRGLDLVYALLNDNDAVILIDATARGGEPGTLYVIEPEIPEGVSSSIQTHEMNPAHVLAVARQMGATLRNVRVVGCEPDYVDDERMGLSDRVSKAVEQAVQIVESLIEEALV